MRTPLASVTAAIEPRWSVQEVVETGAVVHGYGLPCKGVVLEGLAVAAYFVGASGEVVGC
jgi:hypothetical protein